MTNATPVASISSSLLDYYSKLRDHRCRITEGIRVIAFRNVNHLNAAMRHVGVTTGFSDLETISRVQNKMLEDQGLERNDSNRSFLGYATWIPWEIYMCLLCAEIDNYEAISLKHTTLAYAPLEKYLASHQAVVQSLRDVRDKVLHPMNDAALEHILRQFADSARQMSPDHLIALVEAQTQIDDYLEWLRTSLVESVTGEAEALSLKQLFEHLCTGIEYLTRLAAKSADHVEKAQIEQKLREGVELRERSAQHIETDVTLTSRQRQELTRWEERTAVLSLPLPKRPYLSSPDSIQTPLHPELWSFLPRLTKEGQQPWSGQELPEFLRKRRSECIGLLIRSLILQNETYTVTLADLEAIFPGRPRAEILRSDDLMKAFVRQAVPRETAEDYQRAEVRISPGIVALVLLAEPLRLYKQATLDNPKLSREGIDRRIQGDALDTFARLRNIVFHVPDERTDMLKTESDFFDKASSLMDYRELIGSLLTFYLRDPART